MSAVMVFYTVGPAVETRYFPAVSKLKILSIKETEDGQTEVRAAFRKIRRCDYIGIAWYVGERPDDFERVPLAILRDPSDVGSPNRPLGYQKAGPWVIGIPPVDLSRSWAILQHHCHPFWNTVTEFYP
jgi:hypothetical protein